MDVATNKVRYTVSFVVVVLGALVVWKNPMPNLHSFTPSTVVEANREAFRYFPPLLWSPTFKTKKLTASSSLFSTEYDNKPWNKHIAAQIANALEQRKDWIGVRWSSNSNPSRVKLLDYACGTGAITKALGPYVDSVKGIDLSEQMVEQYNAAARKSGLPSEIVNAVVGNLCVQDGVPETLLTPEYFDFDIAVISLGLHHFESPALALRRLAKRLRADSGVLLIIDLLPREEDSHGGNEDSRLQNRHNHLHQHGHHAPENHVHNHQAHVNAIPTTGFSRQDMKRLYEDAGVGAEFDFEVFREAVVIGDHNGAPQRKLFIAKGRRVFAKL